MFTYVVVPAAGYEKCGWHVDAGAEFQATDTIVWWRLHLLYMVHLNFQ